MAKILTVLEIMNSAEFWQPVPDIDFEYELCLCKSEFDRQKVYKKYYSLFTDQIIAHAERGKWYQPYGIDFTRFFTPIEKDAWNAIISSRVILYPQYPVLNYFLDFGNPLLKIGLETDGKEFHIAEKDYKRDTQLLKKGWKIYRVTGSEAVRPLREVSDYSNEYDVRMARGINLNNTVDGVVEALYQVYFNKRQIRDDYYYDCENCLRNHRLADF